MKNSLSFAGIFSLVLATLTAQGAATIAIVNGDPAGVGFNDATVVVPVGGNTGTTLGQQRLIAFQEAGDIWGSTLDSSVTIRVLATWEALTCTSTGAVLGSAGATEIFRDFTGAPVAGHWYSKALANKLFGSDLDPASADIRARFNVNLGKAGCLAGVFFYLGLDGNHGSNVDLVAVLLHEMAHGLGFQTFTSGSSGALQSGFPSIWDDFLVDATTGKTWTQMTPAERVASSLNTGKLVWNGAGVIAEVPNVLQGAPLLRVTAPASVAGVYAVGTASFGPSLASSPVTAEVMPVVDSPGNIGLACTALSAINIAAVNGKIALIDRGTCGFTVKVKDCQVAGAVGVIIVDNAPGSPPPGLGGTDNTITIPSVRITQADGLLLKAALARRSRTHSGMFATLGTDPTQLAGADALNRAMMYAPNPFQGGSSVSHFDTSATPNLLMEPAINGDLTHFVTPPHDLTFKLLKDIGW